MMQNYEDKYRKNKQNCFKIIIHFQKQNNKMTAACSLHLAFDMMAIVYTSLLDTCIKCEILSSECSYKFRKNHFLK
jgi:hypothetical protein